MSYKAFTPADTAIVLVDHQPGVIAMVQSVPVRHVAANVGTLAKLANDLAISHVVTTTRETIERLGTTIDAIQTAAPEAFAPRVRRRGTLDPFADPEFVKAVAATGRRNLVITGVLTDVCRSHAVLSALRQEYRVQVVVDASGTNSTLADDVTHARLRDAGAVMTST